MGLFSRDKPKIKVQTTKKDGFSGWLKCTNCEELIHGNELEKNNFCCPKCDSHYRLNSEQRIALLADPGTFKEMFADLQSTDPLEFVDQEPYKERLEKAKQKAKKKEAVVVGTCALFTLPVCLGVLDFNFMGGSMGMVVGEKLVLLIEYSIEQKLPLVLVSASGGARMQESIFSLMQMSKTAAALAKLHEAGLPYVSVLTNPTTGGVIASLASLGDIILAEPNALICFAGPRVIEQTIGYQLPEGAQRSEFLLKHGMIDCIVRRHNLRNKIAECIEMLTGNKRDFGDDDE